tara:strand:+ start:309 stop:539 length:231 start_codon:yes stop_codon:yes gene_type:complete
MTKNAERLYKIIDKDYERKQSLFRVALNDPKSALKKICQIGDELNIKVTEEEVIEHLSTLDDELTKFWLIKVRGGL